MQYLPKRRYSLTSPYGYLFNTDTSLLRTVISCIEISLENLYAGFGLKEPMSSEGIKSRVSGF